MSSRAGEMYALESSGVAVRGSARRSMYRRLASGVRAWLSARHSLYVEAALVVAFYGTYQLARGLAVGGAADADRHARDVASIERSLHLFGERTVQRAADSLPGLVGVLGGAYLTLHLTVTVGLLFWLHRRRPHAFPFVRTALLFASVLALIGFVLFPTAPPRLAGIGIADTIANERIDINSGFMSSFYNPYAAVPSMHISYALLVALGLFTVTGRRAVQAVAVLYPLTVLLIIIATGNHFFLDAVAGALVAVLAAAAAAGLMRQAPMRVLVPVTSQDEPQSIEQRAA